MLVKNRFADRLVWIESFLTIVASASKHIAVSPDSMTPMTSVQARNPQAYKLLLDVTFTLIIIVIIIIDITLSSSLSNLVLLLASSWFGLSNKL